MINNKVRVIAFAVCLLLVVAIDFVSSVLSILVDLGVVGAAVVIMWPIIKDAFSSDK